jgi:putative Holliday junction resolvase
MRVLGVDFGGKRIGLAVGDCEFGVATSRPNLVASGSLERDARHLSEYAKKEQADLIALGVPLNEPGKSDRMEKICRQLAERMRALGWDVHEVDESMTSVEGAANLASVYRKGAVKGRLDGEAATLILERFFDAQ